MLHLLSIKCDTIEAECNRGQVKEKSIQEKSQPNKNSKLNLPLDSKNNQETDYFLAGLEKEIDTVASPKITKELHDTSSDFFQALGASKEHFITGQGKCKTIPGMYCMTHSKGIRESAKTTSNHSP